MPSDGHLSICGNVFFGSLLLVKNLNVKFIMKKTLTVAALTLDINGNVFAAISHAVYLP